MTDQTRIDIKRNSPKERVEIVGYACWFLGLATILAAAFIPWLDPILELSLLGLGLAMFGIGTGFISLSVSRKSDKRMSAMANLEFYEKIAVVETYIDTVRSRGNVVAKRIKYDLIASNQLNKYVDPKIKEELDKKIGELKREATKDRPKYKDLIKQLTNLQKDDAR